MYKRPVRKPVISAKRRQATIDAMLAQVPRHHRSSTMSKRITLGVSDDYVTLRCPACSNQNLHRRDLASSPERLILQFWCEDCDKRPELTIEQYKSQTRLVWHY